MRLTEEQYKRLLELRNRLKKKVERLRKILREYEDLLKTIDSIIRSTSITTAHEIYEESATIRELEKKCLEIREMEDHYEIYLKFQLRKDDWKYKKYLRDRVLDRFKAEDRSRVRDGELDEEHAFDYEVVTREDGTIECIKVWNCDTARLNRIVEAIQHICQRVLEREE